MALTRFGSALRSHRDLLAGASSKVGTDRPADLRRAGEEVPRQRRIELERIAKEVAGDVRETTDELFSQAAADDPQPEGIAYPFPPEQLAVIALTLTGPDRVRAIIGRLFEACGDDPRHLRYALGFLQWTMADGPAEHLGRALLPVVIADFEELLSALLRLWLTLYPQALGIDGRSVSVEEVTAMRSIEDFKRLQVDERVRLLVNGGHEEWDRVFTKSLNIPLSSLTDAWPVLVEAIARRNAVIHAGGRVDRRYLKQARVCDPKPVLGSVLDCGSDYVASVIDATERIGEVLAVELLCRLSPKNAVAVEAAAEQVFQALLAERWADALRMAETALGCSPAERDSYELQVNWWMACRELGLDWNAHRLSVEAWEPPNGEARYVLAKAALLEDEEAAVGALRQCTLEGPSLPSVLGWPLMVQLRRRSTRVARAAELSTIPAGRPATQRPGKRRKRRQ